MLFVLLISAIVGAAAAGAAAGGTAAWVRSAAGSAAAASAAFGGGGFGGGGGGSAAASEGSAAAGAAAAVAGRRGKGCSMHDRTTQHNGRTVEELAMNAILAQGSDGGRRWSTWRSASSGCSYNTFVVPGRGDQGAVGRGARTSCSGATT